MNLANILTMVGIAVSVALYIVREIRQANGRTTDEIGKVHVLVNSANDRLKEEISQLNEKIEDQAIEIGLLRERQVK